MKGFIVVKGFKHGKQYHAGDSININDWVNKDLERRGLIRWVERPDIIIPKKEFKELKKTIPITKEDVEVKPKAKKRVRKSKK